MESVNENHAITNLAVYIAEQVEQHFYPTTVRSRQILSYITRTMALGVGAFSAYYYFAPAQAALAKLVSEYGMVGTVTNNIMGSSCTIINALFGAQTLIEATHTLLHRKRSSAYTALCTTKGNKAKRVLAHNLNLLGTLGFAAPPCALTSQTEGWGMAILVTLANMPIGFLGVAALTKNMGVAGHSPQQSVFVKYLQERIQDFNTLYRYDSTKALNFCEEIKALYSKETPTHSDSSSLRLEYFETLLKKIIQNYSSLAENSVTSETDLLNSSTEVVKEKPRNRGRRFFQSTVTAISVAGIGGYAWSGGQTIKAMAPKAPLGAQIGGGIALAFLSLCAWLGLSYDAGRIVGQNLFSDDNKGVGDFILPWVSQLLKAIIGFLAVCSGGTNFKVNEDFIREFPELNKVVTEKGEEILAMSYASVGALGAAIVNYYWSVKLADEILQFCARHFKSEIRSFITINQFLQSVHDIFSEMAPDKFDDIIKHLLNQDHTLGRSLLAIFKERLSGKHYQDLLENLELQDRCLSLNRLDFQRLRHRGLGSHTQEPSDSCGLRQRNGYALSAV